MISDFLIRFEDSPAQVRIMATLALVTLPFITVGTIIVGTLHFLWDYLMELIELVLELPFVCKQLVLSIINGRIN